MAEAIGLDAAEGQPPGRLRLDDVVRRLAERGQITRVLEELAILARLAQRIVRGYGLDKMRKLEMRREICLLYTSDAADEL